MFKSDRNGISLSASSQVSDRSAAHFRLLGGGFERRALCLKAIAMVLALSRRQKSAIAAQPTLDY